MRNYLFTFAALLSQVSLLAAPLPLSLMGNTPTVLEVNNCILAKVNGKPITLLDVVKKMDIFFYRQFPQFSEVPAAQHEFYQLSWKHFLDDMIDKELILADAEDCKLQVTPGEVRQEMEALFGPNIVAKLGEIGLTYDAAWDIVKGDLILRRTVYVRVQMKAAHEVTPQILRKAYEAYARDNRHPEKWSYRVISFRAPKASESLALAESIHKQLQNGEMTTEELAAKSEELGPSINVSEVFCLPVSEISELYRSTLQTLTPESYSSPVLQKSRSTKQSVYRIFHLITIKPEGSDPLDAVEAKLRSELIEAAVEKESIAYLKKLKSQFAIERYCDEDQLSNFQPFILR